MNKIMKKQETMYTWTCEECEQHLKSPSTGQILWWVKQHQMKHKRFISEEELLSLLEDNEEFI